LVLRCSQWERQPQSDLFSSALHTGKSLVFTMIPPLIAVEFLTQRRKDAKAQRVFSVLASLRLRVFALNNPCFILEILETRGAPLFGCGWPHWAFPRQKQGLQKFSKKTVDKN
jgi:hypothetical protein